MKCKKMMTMMILTIFVTVSFLHIFSSLFYCTDATVINHDLNSIILSFHDANATKLLYGIQRVYELNNSLYNSSVFKSFISRLRTSDFFVYPSDDDINILRIGIYQSEHGGPSGSNIHMGNYFISPGSTNSSGYNLNVLTYSNVPITHIYFFPYRASASDLNITHIPYSPPNYMGVTFATYGYKPYWFINSLNNIEQVTSNDLLSAVNLSNQKLQSILEGTNITNQKLDDIYDSLSNANVDNNSSAMDSSSQISDNIEDVAGVHIFDIFSDLNNAITSSSSSVSIPVPYTDSVLIFSSAMFNQFWNSVPAFRDVLHIIYTYVIYKRIFIVMFRVLNSLKAGKLENAGSKIPSDEVTTALSNLL